MQFSFLLVSDKDPKPVCFNGNYIISDCNCNKTFVGILKLNVKMFRYNHVDELLAMNYLWYNTKVQLENYFRAQKVLMKHLS